MLNVKTDIGISGEFRMVVKDKHGNIKTDTGLQANLVTNSGLSFYRRVQSTTVAGNLDYSNTGFMDYCAVGDGNAPPSILDNKLSNFIAEGVKDYVPNSVGEMPTDTLHPGIFVTILSTKFVFTDIDNKNITELGLYGIARSNANDRILFTRALIKDEQGNPRAITVLGGDILEVYYNIRFHFDITRKTGEFKVTTIKDNSSTEDTFEYFSQVTDVSVSSTLTGAPYFSGDNSTTTTWGVKETDDELDSSYDLNDADYKSIGFKDIDGLLRKTTGTKFSRGYGYDRLSNMHQVFYGTDGIYDVAKGNMLRGINTHVYNNGIRAFTVNLAAGNTMLATTLVVVKNKANGQGIKKTAEQTWETYINYSINRVD